MPLMAAKQSITPSLRWSPEPVGQACRSALCPKRWALGPPSITAGGADAGAAGGTSCSKPCIRSCPVAGCCWSAPPAVPKAPQIKLQAARLPPRHLACPQFSARPLFWSGRPRHGSSYRRQHVLGQWDDQRAYPLARHAGHRGGHQPQDTALASTGSSSPARCAKSCMRWPGAVAPNSFNP